MDLQIIMNGSPISGLLHASITTSNCFNSDSFAVTLAMGPYPFTDIAFWSSMPSVNIEIVATTTYGLSPKSLITGLADSISLDPIQGTVAVEGRDLSSSMIDGYHQQDFVNQTASEVVSAIAQYHGLTPVVTATSGSVGRYYGDGYTRLSLGQFSRLRSDWDLLVELARENSFDIFVQGTSLFFQPTVSNDYFPFHLSLRDVKSIRFERSLTITANATARVQSWNSQNMAAYDGNSAVNTLNSSQDPSTGADQPFLFPTANLTSQQVTDTAQRYANELGRLGIVLHAEMPWNLALQPRSLILIDETDSAFDSTYQIDSIERHYNTTSGSTQTVRAVIA